MESFYLPLVLFMFLCNEKIILKISVTFVKLSVYKVRITVNFQSVLKVVNNR